MTLVETIFAVGLMALVLFSLASLMVGSLGSMRKSHALISASLLGQQYLESWRARSFDSFKQQMQLGYDDVLDGTKYHTQMTASYVMCQPGAGSRFGLQPAPTPSNLVEIQADVSWGTGRIRLSTCLFNSANTQ